LPQRDNPDSSLFGQARSALALFQAVMRPHPQTDRCLKTKSPQAAARAIAYGSKKLVRKGTPL
jgi:hypothetical protein